MSHYKDYQLEMNTSIQLFVREWMPDIACKAVILHVHGLGEHSGRMEEWAKRFTDEGAAFISYDQRGHGKSDVKKGGPLDIQILINDIKILHKKYLEMYPDVPHILYGHSLGGNEVLNYAIQNVKEFEGIIATSPWLRLQSPPSPFLLGLVKILVKLFPGLRLSNGLDAKDISHDDSEVQKYLDDPHVHDRISVGLFNTTRMAGEKALNSAGSIDSPLLLMHGSGDRITSSGASSEFASGNTAMIDFKMWEDGFHELHNEPNRDEVFSYIIQWMKKNNLLK